MEIKRLLVIAFLLLPLLNASPQQGEDIISKKTELSSLKNEIARLEREISAQSKKEKESLSSIEKYNRQNLLLNKLINKIRAEERAKSEQITSLEKELEELKKETDDLKKSYSRYVVYVYKTGGKMDWSSLLSSGSLNQALIRYKYLKKISERKKEVLSGLKNAQNELAVKKSALEEERKQKRLLAAEKAAEEAGLKKKINEKNTFLKKIKGDKSERAKELALKKQAEKEIGNLIARLVEKERLRKIEEQKKLAAAKKNNKSKNSKVEAKETEPEEIYSAYSGLESFIRLKGRLNWPISGGKIIRKFGENRHVKLNTVTLNYGIDIQAGKDTDVKSVADGIISAVEWVPGYGSVVIITHKDGYRTVFGHLSEIYLEEGESITKGGLIGKVGESLEGKILHFEIWNERNYQNPEIWLAKR